MHDAALLLWQRQLAERRENGSYWSEPDPCEDKDSFLEAQSPEPATCAGGERE